MFLERIVEETVEWQLLTKVETFEVEMESKNIDTLTVTMYVTRLKFI